jgi:hypothetical protein
MDIGWSKVSKKYSQLRLRADDICTPQCGIYVTIATICPKSCILKQTPLFEISYRKLWKTLTKPLPKVQNTVKRNLPTVN